MTMTCPALHVYHHSEPSTVPQLLTVTSIYNTGLLFLRYSVAEVAFYMLLSFVDCVTFLKILRG